MSKVYWNAKKTCKSYNVQVAIYYRNSCSKGQSIYVSEVFPLPFFDEYDYVSAFYPPHNIDPLQRRHNERDVVSNHQPHDCLFKRLFRRRSKKRPKFRVTGLCGGIHRSPVNSPHKGPVTRKMFPFDGVIMLKDVTDIYFMRRFCRQRWCRSLFLSYKLWVNISYGSIESDCYVTFIKYSRIKQSAYYMGYILGLNHQYIFFSGHRRDFWENWNTN